MSTALSPIVSQFETKEQAASYDRWFQAKVQASRDDPRPSIPHDQAMALVREKLTAKLEDQEKTTSRSRSRDV
jgi:hypothetical protein